MPLTGSFRAFRRLASRRAGAAPALLLLAAGSAHAQITFTWLNKTPDIYSIRPGGISADGQTLAYSVDTQQGGEAYRWAMPGSPTGLGSLIPGQVYGSAASGLSADGRVVIGSSQSRHGGTIGEAFRWTEQTGMVGLGSLGVGHSSLATGVSGDGSVVVGWGNSAVGERAFRWTEQTGMVSLGSLPGSQGSSHARAVSGDGKVIVGDATTAAGRNIDFRWTARTGMTALTVNPLIGGVNGISYGGRYLVGNSGADAILYDTLGGGTTVLGDLPGGDVGSDPLSVDDTGTVVVGRGRSSRNDEAFLWRKGKGIVSLHDYLLSSFAPYLPPDFSNALFESAVAITPDSRYLFGLGAPAGDQTGTAFVVFNPRGFAGAPEPATLALLAGVCVPGLLGAMAMALRRGGGPVPSTVSRRMATSL